MKAETIQIEQEQTVAEMLSARGLNPNNFFVSLMILNRKESIA